MAFALGAGLLDACVLAALEKGNTYGYNLTQQIKDVLLISDSTLYPVLRRLQKEGYLDTYDQPYQGRNRRYYALTGTGQERCSQDKREWVDYKARIDQFLAGGDNDE